MGYITLGQRATELSGGEAQRIKLATELQRITTNHTVYLLDEPSTGLHPADIDLLNTQLHRLVEHGHTVIVAEHDQSIIAESDHVIDMGPGAGTAGGTVVAATTPAALATLPDSVTGRYLASAALLPQAHSGLRRKDPTVDCPTEFFLARRRNATRHATHRSRSKIAALPATALLSARRRQRSLTYDKLHLISILM